jgi:hypothetical protein
MNRPFTRRRPMAALSASAALLAGVAVWGTVPPSAQALSGYRVCLYADPDGTWFRPDPDQKVKLFYTVRIYKGPDCPVLDQAKFPEKMLPQPVAPMTCEDLATRLTQAGGTRIVNGNGTNEEEKHPLGQSDGDPCLNLTDNGLSAFMVHLEDYSDPSWPMLFTKGDVTTVYHGDLGQY